MWQLLKRVHIPLKVAAMIAAVYLCYVLLSRHTASQRWEAQQQHSQPAPNPAFDAAYGGTAVKILQFYARDAVVPAGQGTVVCYGVLNARSVRIEPPVSGVYPALGNCVEVRPKRNTHYTLTAEGEDGQTVSSTFTLTVAGSK